LKEKSLKIKLLIFLIIKVNITLSQFYVKADSLNKNRFIASSVLASSSWTSSYLVLSKVWYNEYEKTKLHSFNDYNNWMQMDKAGHIYSTYHFSQQVTKAYRWAGVNNKNSAIIGSSVAWGYLFSIELLDGTSKNWGFSWSDLAANTIGSAIYLSQELGLEKQVFKFKFSYHPSDYAQYRPEVLGTNFKEKILKDYNAQTYWLSLSPVFFLKESKFPKYINLALGYSVDQKLIGDKDFFESFDGKNKFYAKREFILSLDIDVKALNIKKQWLKSLLSPFNSVKIPFPALLWRGNVLYGKILY
jgi:hypothetical protein